MKSATALLVFCLLTATGVRADTIFSTFGAGQSFDIKSPGWSIGGALGGEFAASFAPTQNFTLDTISFAAKLLSGSDPLTVAIATDNASSPGAPIETFDVTSLSSTPTVLTVDSISHPLLSAGATYWVVLSTADSTSITWYWNDQMFVGVSSFSAGAWHASGTEVPTPAFDVTGTLASTTIPEPASIWLLAAALVAGILLCRMSCQSNHFGDTRVTKG
jgi:hypothetical protein